MSAEADVGMTITGNNIDLTPALQEYVEKRIGRPLNKLGGDGIVRDCEVHLSVYKNPKVRKDHEMMPDVRCCKRRRLLKFWVT